MTHRKLVLPEGLVLGAVVCAPSYALAAGGLEFTSLHYALVGFATFFGVGLVAGFVWFRTREIHRTNEETIYDVHEPSPVSASRSESLSVPRATPSTGINVDELPAWPTMAQWLPTGVDEKRCPQCKRTFDATVVICPFDSADLVKVPQKGRVPTATEHPGCTSCGRLYDAGSRFCREDGERLSPSGKLQSVTVYVCQSCGDERLESHRTSCCEEADVQAYDPEDRAMIRPMLPINECPVCHALHAMGETHCEYDGQVLRPVVNLNRRLLAPTGRGPRRKLCAECGRRYSGASLYCCYDGTELEDLN